MPSILSLTTIVAGAGIVWKETLCADALIADIIVSAAINTVTVVS